MRPRILIMSLVGTLLTITSVVVIVVFWRQWFPYQDHIIEHLPASTAAYAHVNITHRTRRILRQRIAAFRVLDGQTHATAEAFLAALHARDVDEIAVAWVHPEDAQPFLAFLVGQRASRRPDVVASQTFDVAGYDARMLVVRTQHGAVQQESIHPALAKLGAGAAHPVQAVIVVGELPLPILQSALVHLPDVIRLFGRFNRNGLLLSSVEAIDGSSIILSLPGGSRSGRMHVYDVALREMLEELPLPFHEEDRAALFDLAPTHANFVVDLGASRAVGFSATVDDERSHSADQLERVLSLLFPRAYPGPLASFGSAIVRSQSRDIRITKTSSQSWTFMRTGQPQEVLLEARRFGDVFSAATSSALLKDMSSIEEFRVSSQCLSDQGVAIVVASLSDHPSVTLTLSSDAALEDVRLCLK